MSAPEIRCQRIRSAAQWKHGVGVLLAPFAEGGFAVSRRPAFSAWISRVDAARFARSVASAPDGRLYWIHRRDGHLYCFDSESERVESLVELPDGHDPAQLFDRIRCDEGRIWVLDRTQARAIALRTDTLQIVGEIVLREPVDLAAGGGRIFTLDGDGVAYHDASGGNLGAPRLQEWPRPVALAFDAASGFLYVVDASAAGFLRLRLDDDFVEEVGRYDDAGPGFVPRFVAIDRFGSLFASDGHAVIHEFSKDGGYVGSTGTMESVAAIADLTIDAAGGLIVASPPGIARVDRDSALAGSRGTFYTGTFDNGDQQTMADGSQRIGLWNRLDLVADVASGGSIDVSFATSDKEDRAELVRAVLARTDDDARKAAELGELFAWTRLGTLQPSDADPAPAATTSATLLFDAPPTHSLLLPASAGRFLWLKLEFAGVTPGSIAAIRELRLYYPRLSYLRYLPSIYQENAASRDFLERYLAIFETVLGGFEDEIERLPGLFDPVMAPPGILDWLGGWLDLGLEEDWPVAVKRELIRRAPELYATKGTPEGLATFVEIVTGTRPIVTESFRENEPQALGDTAALGVETYLLRAPRAASPSAERAVLGRASHLGRAALGVDTTYATDPFVGAAFRFTVSIDLPAESFRRWLRALDRIVREQSPAHAEARLRRLSGSALGGGAVVGVHLRLDDPQPIHLGHSTLGRSLCARPIRYGPQVGSDALLAGPIHAHPGACAPHHGGC